MWIKAFVFQRKKWYGMTRGWINNVSSNFEWLKIMNEWIKSWMINTYSLQVSPRSEMKTYGVSLSFAGKSKTSKKGCDCTKHFFFLENENVM